MKTFNATITKTLFLSFLLIGIIGASDASAYGRPDFSTMSTSEIETFLADKVSGWNDLSQSEKDEKVEAMQSGNGERPDGVKGGRPDGANKRPDNAGGQRPSNIDSSMYEQSPDGAIKRSNSNYGKKARKGESFKKFTGKLRPKKEFADNSKIKNKDAVEFLQQRGVLDGYSDGSFKPQNSINRAESLKVILEALGEEPSSADYSRFTDVPKNAWFTGYVNKAKEKGIIKGYEDGSFKPSQTVNQTELLKIAFESFGIDLSDYEVSDLPDEADENAWYAKYLQYALDNDLLDEDDVDLSEGMTRDTFSDVIAKLIQQQEAL